MAIITSAATGNFSNPATWVGGVVPGPLDNARANTGHNVTIDVDTTVINIQAVSTGRFIMGEGVTLTANIVAPTSTNITLLIPITTFCTIVGNLTTLTTPNSQIAQKTGSGVLNIFGNVSGGSSTGMQGLRIDNSGDVNITGNVTAMTTAGVANANGIVINAICNVTVVGDVSLTSFPTINSISPAIISSVDANVNITGTVRGASAAAISLSGASAILTVVGDIIAPIGLAAGASILMSGVNAELSVTGNVYAGLYGNGITMSGTNSLATIVGALHAPDNNIITTAVSNSATVSNRGIILTGDLYYGLLGAVPFKTNIIRVNYSLNGKTIHYDTLGNTSTRASLTAVDFNVPFEEDVREGVVYGDGTFEGNLIVPSPSNVRKGVPTDNTVGTADLSAQDFLDLLSTSPDPIAERLRNVATVQTTGDQITSLS